LLDILKISLSLEGFAFFSLSLRERDGERDRFYHKTTCFYSLLL
jgi:hypothetical protein